MPNTSATDLRDTELSADAPDGMLIATLAQQAATVQHLDEGVHAVLQADGSIKIIETPGYEAQRERDWAEAYADAPTRVRRDVTVLDVASFVDYLARTTYVPVDSGDAGHVVGPDSLFGAGSLEVWADIDARTIKAYIDGLDGWRRHTATLQLKHSREWGEWASIDGKLLPQAEFAEFIEDHLSTIAEPDGAKLMDICQTLQVHQSAQFKQQSILANGQRVFRYEEDVEAKAGQKGDLTIPGELLLVLRPFQGSNPVAVTARFRYQLRDGVLRIGVKLAEPDLAREHAFDALVATAQESLPVRINHGRG